MPSLIQEKYRFEHPTRSRAFLERFDSPVMGQGARFREIAPRKVADVGELPVAFQESPDGNVWGAEDIRYLFQKSDGSSSQFPNICKPGSGTLRTRLKVSDDEFKDADLIRIETRFMWDRYATTFAGLYIVFQLCGGNNRGVQIILSATYYLGLVGCANTKDTNTILVPAGVWHKYVLEANKFTKTVKQTIYKDDGSVIWTMTDTFTSPEDVYVKNFRLSQSSDDRLQDFYFDYINIYRLDKYYRHGSGYALWLKESDTYSPNFTISEADEVRYEQYMSSGDYTKFSTDGFYIAQDGDTIKVKGTDSIEAQYALTDGEWYQIRAVFHSLYNKRAMKVKIYDSSGAPVWEFAPVYSALTNAFSNTLFSTTTGKEGKIDNLEVYR